MKPRTAEQERYDRVYLQGLIQQAQQQQAGHKRAIGELDAAIEVYARCLADLEGHRK